MMLKNKNAVIYGGGGSLGGTIAKALAAAGARIFLTGKRIESLNVIADQIRANHGRVDVATVDALNADEVDGLLQNVIKIAGTVDISFCAIDYQVVQNMPLVDIKADDFLRPVMLAMQSQFLTTTAAAKVMMKQRSGVILTLTATPGGIAYPFTAGFAPACAAIETLSKNLASELGVYSVRVVNIRSAGSPDSKVFRQAIESNPKEMQPILRNMENDSMLKKLPLMDEIANVAVFLASPMASMITGVTVDVTGGTTAGFNYKVARVTG